MLSKHFVLYFNWNLNSSHISMQNNAPIYATGNGKRFLASMKFHVRADLFNHQT